MYSNTKVISLGLYYRIPNCYHIPRCIFYNYHQWWMVLTISILMLMAILTDYFLFHYVSDRIKELTRVNKELAELKEIEEDILCSTKS